MYNYMNKWFTKIDDGAFNEHWNSLSHSVGLSIMAMIIYVIKNRDGSYSSFVVTKDNINDIEKFNSMELINKFYATIIHIGVWPFTDEDEIDEFCTIYGIGDFKYMLRKDIGNFERFIKDYDYKNVPFTDKEYLERNTFLDEGKINELPIR